MSKISSLRQLQITAIIMLLLLIVGCSSEKNADKNKDETTKSPEAALRVFASAAQKGDVETLWFMTPTELQNTLNENASTKGHASGKQIIEETKADFQEFGRQLLDFHIVTQRNIIGGA